MPQGPGMVGALPRPAWGAVVRMLSLSSREGSPDMTWRATARELRRTCKALAELVGAGCVGGAGWLKATTADDVARLEAAATAGLGRALMVIVSLPCSYPPPEVELLEALAEAAVLAVERGHMIVFTVSTYECPPAAARTIEAALIEASRDGLLLHADFDQGESSGWSVNAMAQLSVVELSRATREMVATLVGRGALQRISLWDVEPSMSILSSLREVTLYGCTIEDLILLADVPLLILSMCSGIEALPAMRNDVLEVGSCYSLADLSGLAGGRVGCLELQGLLNVRDVSAIGAMQPPVRTMIMEDMHEVQDVSMLAGIRRLEVIKCRKLDKAATLAALEGKVGTIRWQEE